MNARIQTIATPLPHVRPIRRVQGDATLRTTMTPPVRTTSPKPSWLARVADRFGATASFLCAVHCAALPLVIAALPAIGLGFLANHRFERGFIAFASVLALSTLIMGFRRHRQFRAFWFLVPGILL